MSTSLVYSTSYIPQKSKNDGTKMMTFELCGQQQIVPLFGGSSRFEISFLSHHSGFSVECDEEHVNVMKRKLMMMMMLMNRPFANGPQEDFAHIPVSTTWGVCGLQGRGCALHTPHTPEVDG